MKKLILIVAIFALNIVQAQILEPVTWSTSVTKISDSEFDLIATATIDSGWHLYSQTVPEDGPIATSFTYEGNGKFLKKGNTQEEEGHTVDDPVFQMEITYFEEMATFKQRIKLKTTDAFTVNGTVEFMVCDDSRCLPPTEVELTFEVK
ncbi:protein-disulfide reductase DsbD domain-containing protein [Algibacter miyuki]|uniref:Protein-disulfide reductase DsbD domain-containing protein n=1 Tax=Algibacter miyuki TaxID=1306933 RepID=A0ABV5H1P0_9FLAO|nr:protein-disulfide reductase DsbD domain-containing protein [Algibacter miyuki]MDN3666603.1 protein-disulfide reductase DsbD family protein [Algibacter miyuki]